MADLSEVEGAFITIIAGALVPNTTYTPYSVVTSTVNGAQFRAFRGWPLDTQLQNDLKSGISNISIFSAPGLARDTTRFLRRMTPTITQIDTPTMTATLSGRTVTFAGTTTVHECIGIGYRSAGYAYRLQSNDTPTSVAAAFAANIPGATSTGSTLTINTNENITVTYGADATLLTELHRQEQIMRVSVWTPTTVLRDQLCTLIDPAIMWYDRFVFTDNSISGPICGAGTHVDDVVGLEFMWRRDLLYKIEYATNYAQIAPPYVLGETTGNVEVFI